MTEPTKNDILIQLQTIRNIGPHMAEKLYHAGIYDLKSLTSLGTEDAYLAIDESGGFCDTHHAGYLYALEAAITGYRWHEVPDDRKIELKQFTQTLRAGNRR